VGEAKTNPPAQASSQTPEQLKSETETSPVQPATTPAAESETIVLLKSVLSRLDALEKTAQKPAAADVAALVASPVLAGPLQLEIEP